MIGFHHNWPLKTFWMFANGLTPYIKEQENKFGEIIIDVDMDEVVYRVDIDDPNTALQTDFSEAFAGEDESDEYATDSGEESEHDEEEAEDVNKKNGSTSTGEHQNAENVNEDD